MLTPVVRELGRGSAHLALVAEPRRAVTMAVLRVPGEGNVRYSAATRSTRRRSVDSVRLDAIGRGG
jgi:hypothetical protein